MKKMKKLMLSFAVIVISISANSQVRVGVQASASVNSPTVSGLPSALKDKVTTVAPGIVFEMPLGPLAFRPSVNYLPSATNLQQTIPAVGSTPAQLQNTQTITKNVQIPLDFTLPIKAGKGKLLLAAGPIVTVGLSADVTVNTTNLASGAPVSVANAPISFGNASGQLKKVEWGSRFGIGYRYKKLDLLAQYKLGLTNVLNNTGQSQKNHIVSLTASWFLIGGSK
jgi:hypothetical protein